MYNCLFDDSDMNLHVSVRSNILSDDFGYYILLKVPKKKVADLIRIGAYIKYIDDGYVLKVHINNTSVVTVNGIRISNYDTDNRLNKIPIAWLKLKEAYLKNYSENSNACGKRSCYAKKLIFTAKL